MGKWRWNGTSRGNSPAEYTHSSPRLRCMSLTHLPLDKMAATLAEDNFKCILLNENDRIPIRFSLKFIPRSPIANKAALFQVMAWRRTGDKPLLESIVT